MYADLTRSVLCASSRAQTAAACHCCSGSIYESRAALLSNMLTYHVLPVCFLTAAASQAAGGSVATMRQQHQQPQQQGQA
jgi:hypothetical protein